jgi:hypothetical protein
MYEYGTLKTVEDILGRVRGRRQNKPYISIYENLTTKPPV